MDFWDMDLLACKLHNSSMFAIVVDGVFTLQSSQLRLYVLRG